MRNVVPRKSRQSVRKALKNMDIKASSVIAVNSYAMKVPFSRFPWQLDLL